LILFGVLITLANNVLSYSFHNYQAELFPARIRARAVGFTYSLSRLSAIFASFIIGFFLQTAGTKGVFGLIAVAMLIVVVAIAGWGPRTLDRDLEEISG
jgi:putative MFS transporter